MCSLHHRCRSLQSCRLYWVDCVDHLWEYQDHHSRQLKVQIDSRISWHRVDTVLVIIKLPFYARTYARTRIRPTPVLVSVLRPYLYPSHARTRIRATPVPVSVPRPYSYPCYARTCIRATPVLVSALRPYLYPCYARTRIRATPVPVSVRTCWCVCCIYIRW